MEGSLDQELRSEFLKLNKPAKYGTAGFRDLAFCRIYVDSRRKYIIFCAY